MFLGQFEPTIDDKGRITLPSRFREELADGAFITAGLDQNLVVMPTSRFEKIYAKINAMNPNDEIVRRYRRYTFARAAKVEFDSAGRFILPLNLREFAKLSNTSVVVGIGEEIEIWAPDLWKEQDQEMGDPDASTAGFEKIDLSIN